MKSRRRWARCVVVAAAVLAVVVGSGAWWVRARLVDSLPQMDGQVAVAGLAAPVTVTRDALGTPTVTASSRIDAARATGFLHAQERFFQMDLMRRRAAGELAELVGKAALPSDRAKRVYRFRREAREIVEGAPADEKALLEAYAAGVNSGLAALDKAPFEYTVLRAEPEPWRPEDSVLVLLSMFDLLQRGQRRRESAMGVLADTLPPALAAFLSPRGTRWDAPVDGGPLPEPPIPSRDQVDVSSWPVLGTAAGARGETPAAAGSNAWAVAGSRTAEGGALLANDMHLPLGVPTTWYRVRLDWPDAGGSGRRHSVTGVTLPGIPIVVVGSNGSVAWGFTNAYADFSDLVVLEQQPGDPDLYRTPDGWRKLVHHRETIHVRGGDDDVVDVAETIWGPVVDTDYKGRRRALRWVALDRQGVNLNMMRLEEARSVEEVVAIGAASYLPGQNLQCVDAEGHIAWTIAGAIPRRIGFDGSVPTSWADGSRRWDGYLQPSEHPKIVDPSGGLIWTANNRVVGGAMLRVLGDGGYDLGARAGQIRDDLRSLGRATEADMLAIQLDDRARFLGEWRKVLLGALTDAAVAGHPRRAEMRRLVESSWTGRASVDSTGYLLVREFRDQLAAQVLDALTAPCRRADSHFSWHRLEQWEGPLWRLATEQPANLLPPGQSSWDGQLLAAVDATIAKLTRDGKSLAQWRWGVRNTTRIRHPLSRALPLVGCWLDMPSRELPGDRYMPRVQAPAFGASERMVVSPGREEQALFHMPCGESGNPISRHYRDGEIAWEKGLPTPFLPGSAEHTLVLVPAGS